MPDEGRTKPAAILAADAVGYSHAVAIDEALALTALANSRELIDAEIERHGGRIFNTAGDSVLAEFPAAPAAAVCALAIQAALNPADHEGPLLGFRIGISAGQVTRRGSDLLGATVNLAARLEAIAPAGGVAVSGAVHEAIAGDPGVPWQDLGLRHLKNLIRPVRVFRYAPPGASPLPALAEASRPVIIVLPFVDPGGSGDEAYLSDGITEDVITGLSRFGQLAVLGMASSTAVRHRGADLGRLVAELGVDYVVEGSVRRAGKVVRLSAQLLDARSGLTLWAERYDRVLDDLFAVQDEISATVVATLAGELEQEAAGVAARKRPENLAAHDFLLRGIHSARGLDRASAAAALAMFDRALGLDPDYAPALAWSALMQLRLWAWDPASADIDAVLAQAERAVARDSSDSWCHLVVGQVTMYRGELVAAEQHHQRAYELNPFDAHIMALRAPLATYLGKPEEGEQWIRRALALNPRRPDWYVTNLGLALYGQRRYGEAAAAYASVAAPQIGVLAGLAASAAEAGDRAATDAAVQRVLALAPDFSADRFVGYRPFRRDADRDNLRRGLELAGLPG